MRGISMVQLLRNRHETVAPYRALRGGWQE